MNKKVEENFSGKHIIKMNIKAIFELPRIRAFVAFINLRRLTYLLYY